MKESIYLPTVYNGNPPESFVSWIEKFRKLFGLNVWTVKIFWCTEEKLTEIADGETGYKGYTLRVENGYRLAEIYVWEGIDKEDYERVAYHELRHIHYFENIQGLYINYILPLIEDESLAMTFNNMIQEKMEKLIVEDWETYKFVTQ